MPSFDTVSEIDHHELTNAVDQANKEISTRYDFKGSDARIEFSGEDLMFHAQSRFQLQQMFPVLMQKMSRRGLDINCLKMGDVVEAAKTAKQPVSLQEGVDKDVAKKIVKLIKESKIKVQASIQGEQVRVTGKNRDDLQQAMQLMKGAELGIPLQFNNFRD
ncbi:MAG: YajQ family cyclic di-GMP-binding protein [Gammaproteobacteria bacterium]|nr:YajQ family cyclic di-GMP-binding protein [Gammaproteobacteria bacterium]MBL7000627.1 YajQ family cyclic di-GMP-binding protein [Gammaproteobacteria bacterium]